MKVEVTRTTKTKEMVEVNLPYFYRHDVDLDYGNYVIFGKIDEDWHRSVKIRLHYLSGLRAVEIESEFTHWDRLSCYLADEYKSNATEYERAKQMAIQTAQDA